MPTDLKSFDLPSESEMRFNVNPNPDFIIEYALSQILLTYQCDLSCGGWWTFFQF